ncbi:MAG: hypothetical protein KDA27_29025, partial [Candidatus Eisenbacteria bacterium]|nr:hypothetical protein [Candidatus Eisenbacteria bacterium]
EASGIIGCTSLRTGYPSLVLDESKWDPMVEDGGQYRGGIRHWEGVLAEEPLQYPVEGFEPLYAPDTFDLTFCCGPVAPRYEDAMIAHRYESPFGLGDWRYQGRTVVFDFQPWYFESDGVSEACRNAVDWLVDGLAAPGRGSVGHLSSAGGARLRLR